MNPGALTEDQQRIRDLVMRKINETDDAVAVILLREPMRREDRAAVADHFCPGAGKDYLK